MSLVGSLARVAIAIAAARGIAHVFNQARQAGARSAPDYSRQRQADQTGSDFDQGLGSLLEQLGLGKGTGGATSSRIPNLDDLIRGPAGQEPEGSFADVLNDAFQKHGEPEKSPTPEQDAAAGLMLRAMLQAAKSDGRIDEGEKNRILDALGDASREEMDFVNRELSSPVDVQALAKQVPKGLEKQMYAASLMGIDLDSENEAAYLSALASAMGMGPREVNAIHAKLGAPAL